MSHRDNTPTIRREDGSLDLEFYASRAILARKAAPRKFRRDVKALHRRAIGWLFGIMRSRDTEAAARKPISASPLRSH